MSAHLDLINYRKEKAKDTLEDARILFNANRLHSTVNRIYYALFYSVLALLHTDNLFSAKHSGVKSIFNERFVKTGKVDAELGRFYSRMFEFRQQSDYGDYVKFEKEKVKEWLGKAKDFLHSLEQVIENEINSK